MSVDNERWLHDLKAAVEQGFYKTEAAEDAQEPLPAVPPQRSRAMAELWTNEQPIDREMLYKGYLESPRRDGSRFIPGLETIVRDIHDGGISICWADAKDHGTAAQGEKKRKLIRLDRRVYEQSEETVRAYMAGMAGSMLGSGTSVGADYVWAHRRYGGLAWWVERYS